MAYLDLFILRAVYRRTKKTNQDMPSAKHRLLAGKNELRDMPSPKNSLPV
jgi:hypothetical protein